MHVAAAVVVILPGYLVILRGTGVHLVQLFRACLLPTIAAFPAALAGWLIARQIASQPISLLGGGLAAVGIYLLVMGRWLMSHLRAVRGSSTDEHDRG